jgi:hypothetical protein
LVNRAAAFTGENGPYWRNAAALGKGNIARSTVRTGSQGFFRVSFSASPVAAHRLVYRRVAQARRACLTPRGTPDRHEHQYGERHRNYSQPDAHAAHIRHFDERALRGSLATGFGEALLLISESTILKNHAARQKNRFVFYYPRAPRFPPLLLLFTLLDNPVKKPHTDLIRFV